MACLTPALWTRRRFPELKGFDHQRYKVLNCPTCIRGYPNVKRRNMSDDVYRRLHRFDPISDSDGGYSNEYGSGRGEDDCSDSDEEEDGHWQVRLPF